MLEVDRIAKRNADVVACQDVSFTVPPGSVVGLAGGGSSTVLRIASGLLAPDAGEVRLAGESVTIANRARLGYLPAAAGLYQRMHVHDHLVYLAELRGAPVNDAHRAADFWLARFGLRDRYAARVRTLDAAAQRRLHLAAVLVTGPAALVLDEPFAGLDRATADLLVEVLRDRTAAGVPVLLSSRDLDLVERVCDRVCVLHNGRVVAEGAVRDLTGRHECVVTAPAAAPGWTDSLPGVTVLAVHNGRTRLTLSPGADDQAVLAAARATGPVLEFTVRRAGLADDFGAVVAE